MSKDFSIDRFLGGSSSSLNPLDDEGNENEFKRAQNPAPCPPSRSPLSSIPDPSQNAETDLDPKSTHDSNQLRRLFEKKADVMEYVTPRNGRRKSHSEPNSAQSTPTRSISRFSNAGGSEAYTGSRPPQHAGGRGGGISRSSRGLSAAPPPLSSCEVPHFELMEDSSFWMDHNVQIITMQVNVDMDNMVLIRIRPLSGTEKVLQGSGRCLRQESAQTLTWLGPLETRFTFDHVACETISQEKLFKVAGLPMVENCMSGYNSCMFAYGQTGSGKTYTMIGDIFEMDNRLSEDCGMTPRIFEYLFMRIREEEENRRDERLKYSCKCSFLEIYNEQITDLLQPESTNLQLREDMKKGVYVENLKEYEVTNVKDVLKLLLQGAANRKIAATHVNGESSRSHSVFTCVIESRWEKDSMAHVRFGRLNLVDLAGSERQKSSGAEGDRLKEAANINKSLSTLGLVIMTLVDVAHGKQRHVPYRDSRLTFLLQAKVNEDASGDVIIYEQAKMGDSQLNYDSSSKEVVPSVPYHPSVASRKLKYLESTLVGALRREKTAETTIRRLEAENEHLSRLVNQREEDAQCTRMLLRFREEKIRKMEMLADGLFAADEYLIEENKFLSEEIQLLQARVDKNPEITRFAMENIRLIEQLRMFQDFYELGEREYLLAEVSELRDQLLEILEGRLGQTTFPEIKAIEDETEVEKTTSSAVQERDPSDVKVDSTMVELEDCRKSLAASLERNAILTKQVEDLHGQLKRYLNSRETGHNVELTSASRETQDVIASPGEVMERLMQNTGETMDTSENLQPADAQKEMIDARYLVEALEAQQLQLIEELDNLRQENSRYLDLLQHQAYSSCLPVVKLQTNCEPPCRHRKNHELREQSDQILECGCNIKPGLEENWERMKKDLEAARSLNCQYQYEQESQQSHKYELERVCEEVEVETSKTILHLQEEVATLHHEIDSKNENESFAKSHYWLLRMENQKLQDRVCILTQENISFKNAIASRDNEINSSNEEWEKAVVELTSFLVDGRQSLEDASDQIESIVHSFSEKKAWVGEEVEKAVKVFIEQEQIILDLQNRVEDAQNLGLEMKLKLNELKRAALAMTEVQELEKSDCLQDVLQFRMLLNEKICTVKNLETQIKIKEDQIIESEKQAYAAFLTIKVLREMMTAGDTGRTQDIDTDQNIQILEEIRMQLERTMQSVLDSENFICASYIDTEKHLSSIIPDILNTFAAVHQMIRDLSNEICTLRKKLELKKENTKIPCLEGTYQSLEVCGFSNPESQYAVTQLPRSELANTNEKRDPLKTGFERLLNLSGCSVKYGDDAAYGVCMKRLSQLKCVDCSNEMSAEEEMHTRVKDSRQFAEEKMKQANNLLLKFEEAQETIKEADIMLNALLKVNENSKHKTNKWKQAAEELMIERASLVEEVQQLEASIQLKEEKNDLLQDQIHDIPEYVAETLSLLDNLFTDMCSSRQVLLDLITASRSWLEDICAQVMEKMFALFVQYQCYIGALSDKCLFFNKYCKYLPYGQTSPLGSVGNNITSSNGEKVLKEESKHELHSPGDRNPIKTVQAAAVSISDVDSVNSGESDLAAEVKHLIEEVSKSEKEKSDLAHDMLLIELAINRQLACLEKLEEELTALYVASNGTGCILRKQNGKTCDTSGEQFHSKGSLSSENASHSIMFKDHSFQSQKIQMQKVGSRVNEIEPLQAGVGGVTSDEDGLLAGIHYLKAWCTQMITVLAETKDHTGGLFWQEKGLLTSSNDISNGILIQVMKTQTERLDCSEPRSEYGQRLIQQLKKLEGKLTYLKDYIKSRMYGETRNVFNEFLVETLHQGICNIEEKAHELLLRPLVEEAGQTDLMLENLSLKRELARKEFLLEGLFFDLRLLQESTSNVKDIKDETEEMVATLSQVQEQLACKSTLMDETLVRFKDLEVQLADREAALSCSKSELGRVKETLDVILADNTELRLLLEDIYLEKNNAEQQLEEKEEIVQGLEREILQMASSIEERIHSSVVEIEEKLRRVTSERDQFQEEMVSLNGKLEMSKALADENEAIAVEARQVAEASKGYAEQKEEEVRILEHSVEELECTINVLEQKVDEMGEEVERHRAMREDLELELQALRSRMLNVENATENFDAESSSGKERIECQLSRKIDDRITELIEAKRHIRTLEKEKAEQEKECKDYISELVLHSEAQASQYQQKYKSLEDMVREAQANPATMNLAASTTNKMEKSAIRSRGSGSPFKCIASLVQQMNSEKDQELKLAQLQIEELEALAASRQKEICMLNARLARTENMTHDVIRDLLGVKLDITNYANLIDQLQLQKLAETSQQQTEESNAKEQEILRLRKQIDDFIAERESWIEEVNQRQAEMLTVLVTVEQLQQRDQLLMAQNEMLKKEKANLKKKVGQLDEMVRKLFGSQDVQRQDKSVVRIGNDEVSRRLANSEKLLSHVNDELAQYSNFSGNGCALAVIHKIADTQKQEQHLGTT
ncbi:hypothetical protein ACLOJK_021986 [Asimina triloba]